MLCVVVGTGLLQLPHGVSQSGWIGVLLLVMMAAMACYTAVILGKCLHLARARAVERLDEEAAGAGSALPSPASSSDTSTNTIGGALAAGTPLLVHQPVHPVRRPAAVPATIATAGAPAATSAPIRSYGDIGHAAFGPVGRWFVVVQMHLTLVMVGTIYQLLTSINLIDVVSPGSDSWLTETRSALLLGGFLWFHVFLTTLSEVAILSYLNICINVALLAVVIAQAMAHPPAHPPSHALLGPNARTFGSAFASFGFA
jgi:vesicular inhibitory amino acid transporter